MVDAFKKMIANWKDFSGKATRADYWWAQLAYVIISMVAYIPGIVLLAFAEDSTICGILGGLLTLVVSIFFIFLAVADISLSIRRLRDAGFPWWFFFIGFIPTIGNIAFIVFMCFPSSDVPVIDFGTSNGGTVVTDVKPAAPAAPTAAPATPAAPVVDVTPTEAPVVDADSWTCPACGAACTGKFCPKCGTPKQ